MNLRKLVQKVEREGFGSYCLRDGSEIFGPRNLMTTELYTNMSVSDAIRQHIHNHGVLLEQPNIYMLVFKGPYFISIGNYETV
jgi:hypothetical protein